MLIKGGAGCSMFFCILWGKGAYISLHNGLIGCIHVALRKIERSQLHIAETFHGLGGVNFFNLTESISGKGVFALLIEYTGLDEGFGFGLVLLPFAAMRWGIKPEIRNTESISIAPAILRQRLIFPSVR